MGIYTQNAANAALNQYTTVPAMPSDNATLDTYESLYDENGNVGSMLQFPRHGDLDGDYDRDLSDITLFTSAFQNEEPAADLNGDGVWDASDLNLFIGSPESYEHVSLVYDWRNQLVGFLRSNGTDELVSAEYRYDCFNRRIASIIDLDGDGTADETPHFVYGGQAAWQLFEEYNGPGSTATRLKSYVYGNYIDEVLQMRNHPSGEDFYFHQDDLFSVYAITDDTGAVVERYEYGDYGQVTVRGANNADRDPDMDGQTESLYGNRHTFTGRLLDHEMTLAGGEQMLQYRRRSMAAASGRFLQRDAMLYVDSPNSYCYVASNPLVYLDPTGNVILPSEFLYPDRTPWQPGKRIKGPGSQPFDLSPGITIPPGSGAPDRLRREIEATPNKMGSRTCKLSDHGKPGHITLPDGTTLTPGGLDRIRQKIRDGKPLSPGEQNALDTLNTLNENCDKVIFETCFSDQTGIPGKLRSMFPDTEWEGYPGRIWIDPIGNPREIPGGGRPQSPRADPDPLPLWHPGTWLPYVLIPL